MIYEPESLWLLENCPVFSQEGHTYVDLGCAHPVNKSLSNFVRLKNWHGVAVDANHAYKNDWEAAGFGEHFHCAILSDKPVARFTYHENSFTSRISNSRDTDRPEKWGLTSIVNAPTTPLKEILAQHGIGKIQLLTVDLEGHEFEVLSTLDFDTHGPSYVVVEYVTEGIGIDCRAANLLISNGYRMIQMFPSNLIFSRE